MTRPILKLFHYYHILQCICGIYDKKTKFCIYDAEYINIEDKYEDTDPICAVITRIMINIDPNQHPSDIDDFGTVADLLEKEQCHPQ